MNNKQQNKKLFSRLLSGFTLAALLMAMSVTGALGGFWRTLDGLTDSGVPNPLEFLFGYGVDENGAFGYGYGYGYGTNSIDDGTEGYNADGTLIVSSTSSTSGGTGSSSTSGGTGSSSSSSSGGGGGSSSSSSGSSSGLGSSSGVGSSSSSSSTSSSNGGVNIDTDKYITDLRDLQDRINDSKEDNVTPAPGLQLPSILPQTGTAASAKGIKTYAHPSVETAFPAWLKPTSLATAPTEASYWINTIPYAEDRNASSYVVIPTTGVVAPINASNATEAAKAISGQSYDYATPLTKGAAHYPGTQKPGENGTSVLFGHSSDYKRNAGNYKTIFGKIIELDAGEEVWVYTKNATGGYDRMRFVVEISKEIAPTDTNILLPQAGKNLALFTCTPIGGISGRWYVNARLVEEPKEGVYQEPNIAPKYKFRINVAMNKFKAAIAGDAQSERERKLAIIAYRIEKLEMAYADNEAALALLAYIKQKVAEML